MMRLSLAFANVCRTYKYTSTLWKTKTILCVSPNRSLFHKANQYSALTVSASTCFVSFHCCAALFAKQFQERENEYAHSIMSNIDSYSKSILKYPLTLQNGPLDSNSTKISQVQELFDFSKEKGDESHAEQLIFVYGSLKRNEPNQDLVLDTSKGKAIFLGMGRTVQKFPLVIASRYNIPFLLHKEGVGKHVVGELYKVDKDMLLRMDALEGNGKYYIRMAVEVQPFIPDDGARVLPIVNPWVYFLMNFREHLLDLPYLEDYSSEGPHGLKFVSRHLRPPAEHYSYEVQNEKEGEPKAQHLIFVYGTLKRNEPNHDLVLDSSKGKAIFVGMGRTVQKFPLVIASRYNIPFLLYKEDVGKQVVGELYKVDEAMLETMDELENNGKYYNRIQVDVQRFIPDDGDRVLPVVKPWIYFLMNFREHLLDLPYIENYSSKGPHGLEYVCRYNGPLGKDYYHEILN